MHRMLLLIFQMKFFFPSESFTTNRISQLVQFSASIIEHLSPVPSGSFECWFYLEQSTLPRSESVIQQILLSDMLVSISKVVLSSPVHAQGVPIQRSQVLFFEFHSIHSTFTENQMLWNVHPKAKIIIFVPGQSCVDIPLAVHSVFKLRFQVIYLLVDSGLICRSLPLVSKMLEYREPFPMAALFDDYTRDLEGHPIVCVTLGLDSALYNSVKGIYQGPSIVWLEYTARMLNATPRSFFTACTMMNYECFSKAIVRKDRFNDLILDTVGVLRVSPSLFTRVDPSSMVIVTPRGSRFTVDELFSNPLSLAVWIVLVVFLVALKILKIFFPSHFKNDLFLVSLCGLEIKSMKKSSSSERMAVTALTIFFFIVLNAYETKLISLMTSKPRNEDIDSIEDLNRTGIAILLPPHKLSKIEEESLNLRFEHISGSMDGDGVLAVGRTYLFDSGSAALLKHMCRGDDKMFSLYKVLDEKVKMTILGNYIFKPDLMDPFARTHKRMVESGLQSFLKDKLAIQNVGGLLRYSYLKQPAEVVTVLDIEDLKPAWVSFGIGLLICCGVFCWEVLVGLVLSKFKIKFKKYLL